MHRYPLTATQIAAVCAAFQSLSPASSIERTIKAHLKPKDPPVPYHTLADAAAYLGQMDPCNRLIGVCASAYVIPHATPFRHAVPAPLTIAEMTQFFYDYGGNEMHDMHDVAMAYHHRVCACAPRSIVLVRGRKWRISMQRGDRPLDNELNGSDSGYWFGRCVCVNAENETVSVTFDPFESPNSAIQVPFSDVLILPSKELKDVTNLVTNPLDDLYSQLGYFTTELLIDRLIRNGVDRDVLIFSLNVAHYRKEFPEVTFSKLKAKFGVQLTSSVTKIAKCSSLVDRIVREKFRLPNSHLVDVPRLLVGYIGTWNASKANCHWYYDVCDLKKNIVELHTYVSEWVVAKLVDLKKQLRDLTSYVIMEIENIINQRTKDEFQFSIECEVQKRLEDFLKSNDFVMDALPSTFMDQEPSNMDVISQNLSILVDMNDPHTPIGVKAKDFVLAATPALYQIVCEVEADYLCFLSLECARPMAELKDPLVFAEVVRALRAEDYLSKYKFDRAGLLELVDDLAYMREMRHMDDEWRREVATGAAEQRPLKLTHVVPIVGRFFGEVNALRVNYENAMELWGRAEECVNEYSF